MCAFFFAATLGCCSDRRKSVGPSAPIAYATSVSPPNEAIAWLGRRYWISNDAAAWSGRRCWMQDMAATWQVRRSCKSPRTLLKCKYLITKQLTFIAVRGGLNLCSPSTVAKVNCLVMRCLYFGSVRGDLQEGNGCASRC